MSQVIAARKPAVNTEAAEPEKRLVATIKVDGRPLQTVTEWWTEKPADVHADHDSETGMWLTSRIYDPITRVSHHPARLQR